MSERPHNTSRERPQGGDDDVVDGEAVEIDANGDPIDQAGSPNNTNGERKNLYLETYPKDYEPIYKKVLDTDEFHRLLSFIDEPGSHSPETKVPKAIRRFIDYQIGRFSAELREWASGAAVALEVPDEIKDDLAARLQEKLEEFASSHQEKPEARDSESEPDSPGTKPDSESVETRTAAELLAEAQELATTYIKELIALVEPKVGHSEFLSQIRGLLGEVQSGNFSEKFDYTHKDKGTNRSETLTSDSVEKIFAKIIAEWGGNSNDPAFQELYERAKPIYEAIKQLKIAVEAKPVKAEDDDIDTAADKLPLNPEALAEAQRLAKEYWDKRGKFIQEQLKADPTLIKKNWGFELARAEAALKQIETGDFTGDFTVEGTLYDKDGNSRKASKTQSLEDYFKNITTAPEHEIQVPSTLHNAAKRQEIRDQAAEILAAIERMNKPETAQEKQERLAQEARRIAKAKFDQDVSEHEKTTREWVESDEFKTREAVLDTEYDKEMRKERAGEVKKTDRSSPKAGRT